MKLDNPFVRKSDDTVQADPESRLWPTIGGGRAFTNYMLFNNNPYWISLHSLHELFECYHRNPVLYATVMIKAREYANMRIKVVNRSTQVEEPETTRKAIPAAIYKLFNEPNVLQSKWEFLLQRKIFEEVAGNSFTYGNFTMGMKPSINTIAAMWNVWPAYMKYRLAGNYFDATKIEDIISSWQFAVQSYTKEWKPYEIMLKNKPNTNPQDGLILGRSPAASLTRPLSNIEMAYESRNVMMQNRGMRVILSSASADASGKVPLLPNELDDLQDAVKNYGTLRGQKQFFLSPVPVDVNVIDQDVRKLGLFEEIALDAMTVSNAYGVPETLLKLYLKGATFENQEAAVRRLYQGTLIPEAEDDMIAFNSWLGLDETDWIAVPSFDHVAALQESEKEKAQAEQIAKETAIMEYEAGLITREEYRERQSYGTWPKDGTVSLAAAPVANVGSEPKNTQDGNTTDPADAQDQQN